MNVVRKILQEVIDLKKRMLFVVNPSSGTMKIKDSLLEVCQIFCDNGYELTLNVTKYITDAINEAINKGMPYDLIVCCGGDGTFNGTVSSLIQLDKHPPVGYIPSGSTNDFARTIGLNGNAKDIARQIMAGFPHTLDMGSFNKSYFSYVASFGAFTEASYNTPQDLKNKLGHLAYVLEGVKDISTIEPCHMRIRYEDKEIEGNYIFGAVCNSTSIGGLIRLNEDHIDLSDGLFEIMLIKAPKTIIDLTKIVVSITTQVYDPEIIQFFQASDLYIYPETEVPWSLDGEYAPGSKEIHVQNMHHAIQLIL